ncbi:MAG: hypothetical protein AAB368_16790, partial [bacterium]
LGLAFRFGALLPGATAASADARGAAGDTQLVTWNVTPRLFPFLVGAWSEGGTPRGLRFRGACFLGAAYARAAYAQDLRATTAAGVETKQHGTATWDGWVPIAAEITGEASYPLGRGISLAVELGVRLAAVRRLSYAADADVNGDGTRDVRQGDALKGSDGKNFKLDFGGALLRAGLKVAL